MSSAEADSASSTLLSQHLRAGLISAAAAAAGALMTPQVQLRSMCRVPLYACRSIEQHNGPMCSLSEETTQEWKRPRSVRGSRPLALADDATESQFTSLRTSWL